jgi:hypothetical protein
MNANIHAFGPVANDEFDDEPAAPYPNWLWNGYFRTAADAPREEVANPGTNMAYAVLVYLAVWFFASLFASACIATLATLFR